MNNIVVLPLLIPLFTAVLLLVLHRRIRAQKILSVFSATGSIFVATWIVHRVSQEGILTLKMGGWLPPYGIVFVADMFVALLVLATAIVAFFCLLFAFGSIGEEREKHHFYPFVFFLLAGVTGSFLTGDLFNLFVCFEVMLIASYALMVSGGTKRQLRESLKYILINIISSSFFVAAIAYLYAVTGTLNMAHLAERVTELQQGGLLNAIAVLFLVVFSLKGALFLFFWLPGSYGAPPAVVMALFGGLLTKVGLYAIIRTFTLIFPHDPMSTHFWIGIMAALTMILGGIGAIAYRDIPRIMSYNIIAGVGFIAMGLAAANIDALGGVVYYIVHDMLAKTLLLLLGGIMIAIAGSAKLHAMGGWIRRFPYLGWMLFITILALVGVPPLSGFIGKLLLIRGTISAGLYGYAVIGLLLSLVLLYSLMRMFMLVFWGEEKQESIPMEEKWKASTYLTIMCAPLLLLAILLGVYGEWVMAYVTQATEVLLDPGQYIQAVLKERIP